MELPFFLNKPITMKRAVSILLFILFTIPSFGQVLREVYDKPTQKKVITLNSTKQDEWKLYFCQQKPDAPSTPLELEDANLQLITGTVPGNVEIDLEREGIIDDPMLSDNVYDLRKYETITDSVKDLTQLLGNDVIQLGILDRIKSNYDKIFSRLGAHMNEMMNELEIEKQSENSTN